MNEMRFTKMATTLLFYALFDDESAIFQMKYKHEWWENTS